MFIIVFLYFLNEISIIELDQDVGYILFFMYMFRLLYLFVGLVLQKAIMKRLELVVQILLMQEYLNNLPN
jgi:hypothetical protein